MHLIKTEHSYEEFQIFLISLNCYLRYSEFLLYHKYIWLFFQLI